MFCVVQLHAHIFTLISDAAVITKKNIIGRENLASQTKGRTPKPIEAEKKMSLAEISAWFYHYVVALSK